MTDKPSDILARAADILMERGWTKDTYLDDDGRVCLMGAICTATGCVHRIDVPAWRAADYVTKIVSMTPVERFNDQPDTTFDMVIGALHEAQLAAKEAGQ